MNDDSNVVDIEKNGEEWHSLSCMSDSTDQSVPVNFDMYNRVNITAQYKLIIIIY